MIFEQGQLYRNKHMRDIDMYVVKVLELDDVGSHIRIRYITRTSGALVGDYDNVTVLTDLYNNWSKISGD